MSPEEPYYYEIETRKYWWIILLLLYHFGFKIPHRLHRYILMVQDEILMPVEPPTSQEWFFVLSLGTIAVFAVGVNLLWLLWSLWGKEVVRIDREQLRVEYTILSVAWKRRYILNRIADLRLDKGRNAAHSVLRGGNIAFTYDGHTKRFGLDLNEADAKDMIDTMQPYLPEVPFTVFKAK